MASRGRKAISYEQVSHVILGLLLLGITALAYWHSPLWLLALIIIGVNLIQSSLTGWCVVKSLLVAIGIPGERDLGRQEAGTHAEKKPDAQTPVEIA